MPSVKIDHAASERAPQALLAHIRAKYGSIPAFCDAKGLDRIKVQKAIRGEIQRMDVDFAFAVERATDGDVPAFWWAAEQGAA